MDGSEERERYAECSGAVMTTTLDLLGASEQLMRWLHPRALPRFAELLAPYAGRTGEAVATLRATAPPADWEGLHEHVLAVGEAADAWSSGFSDAEGDLGRLLASFTHLTHAYERLYELRRVHPSIARFFTEPARHPDVERLDPLPAEGVQTGLHTFSDSQAGKEERGGLTLYVPETFDGTEALPLVVALHGGMGGGRDFIWTWLRQARSRRFLLMAPTSRGSTWSLMGADIDAEPLFRMVDEVCTTWNVDRERILLTGFSDGATYSMIVGLHEEAPFSALAPISGILHPRGTWQGNLERVRDRRIYLVHGKLDWMFPVGIAQLGRDMLQKHGADLVYREIEDLSHAYPREENDAILTWFDSSLALPESPL